MSPLNIRNQEKPETQDTPKLKFMIRMLMRRWSTMKTIICTTGHEAAALKFTRNQDWLEKCGRKSEHLYLKLDLTLCAWQSHITSNAIKKLTLELSRCAAPTYPRALHCTNETIPSFSSNVISDFCVQLLTVSTVMSDTKIFILIIRRWI